MPRDAGDRAGSTKSIICGLTAKTTASGTSSPDNTSAALCQAMPFEPANASGRPAGSMTMKVEATPRASQPRSIAEPIWPQPTRTSVSALTAGEAARPLMASLGPGQASPIGSIIAVAIASSGGLPPQITSWKAG